MSKRLAEILKRPRVSTDELIEEREKRLIADIFTNSGEKYFRDLEKKIIHEISNQHDLIIDCGGGIVLQPENLINLEKNGILFHLDVSSPVAWRRLQDKTNRPLLKTPNPQLRIAELINERKPFYNQADIIINTDSHTVEDTAQEILSKLRAKS